MGYTGEKIIGCDSPSFMVDDHTQYPSIIDTQVEEVDLHNHTSGKGELLGTNSFENSSVTGPKIALDSLEEHHFADDSIPPSKLDRNIILGDEVTLSGVTNTNSWEFEEVIGLTLEITTQGRPVEIGLRAISNEQAHLNNSQIEISHFNMPPLAIGEHFWLSIEFLVGSYTIMSFILPWDYSDQNAPYISIPPSGLRVLTELPSGTHTIKVRASKSCSEEDVSNLQAYFERCRLYAKEWPI